VSATLSSDAISDRSSAEEARRTPLTGAHEAEAGKLHKLAHSQLGHKVVNMDGEGESEKKPSNRERHSSSPLNHSLKPPLS